MSHNKRLKQLFEQVDRDIERAHSQDELLKIINNLRNFGAPLRYKTAGWKIASALLLLTAGIVGFWAIGKSQFHVESLWFYVVIAFVVVSFVLAYKADKLDKAPINCRYKLFRKDVLLDNQLEKVDVNPFQYAKKLSGQFFEFHRGNYACFVKNVLRGPLPDQSKSDEKVEVYTQHYINERTETYVIPNGNGGTTTQVRVVHDDYYRYGIIIPFVYPSKIGIFSDKPNKILANSFSPASLRFSKQYYATGDNEHELSKFLSPSVVLFFEEMATKHPNFNFELSGHGYACLSVSEKEPMEFEILEDLDDFDAFYEKVARKNKPPVLLDLVDFSKKLKTMLKNNL